MGVPAFIFIGLLLSTTATGELLQPSRLAAVRLVVRDITGLPIIGADVVLTNVAGSTTRAATDDRGVVTFEELRPGTYSGQVASAGFTRFEIEPFTVGAGARVLREITMQVAGFTERLDVVPSGDDLQHLRGFTDQFTEEQLAALPEDPDELALVLRQLAGDGAEIRVNGFSGGRLPPGTQIRDVRIRYDVGASTGGDGPRIDIRTTPGGDRWRNNATVTVRDEALSSRNAFSGVRPAGQTRQYAWNLEAPLVRNRSGLSVSIDGSGSTDNQVIRAALPAGWYSSLIRQPSNGLGLWMRVEHEINAKHSIRAELTRNVSRAQNQGMGELDLPERAFAARDSDAEIRFGHHATLGGRFINDLTLVLAGDGTEASAVTDAPTIRVLDAFTAGGAGQRGGRQSRTFRLENDLEFVVRRRHQMRVGVSVDSADYRSDEHSNASGTYTFVNLAAFEAGQPATFTQRLGDPNYAYSMLRAGWHVRDDYRVRRHLLLNLGLRHDVQTHLPDWVNVSPRIGINWTPSSKARTALSANFVVLPLPLTASTYGQTLLVDGFRQWDLVMSNPGYPDPLAAGVAQARLPPSITRARADLQMPVSRRYSIGVGQPIGKFLRFRGTVSYQTGHHLFRSRDANAPVGGVRPDRSAGTVTELESTARSRNAALQTELSINYPPARLSANVNYTLGRAMDEADSPFSLPANSYDLSGEWGPARNDVRHRVSAGVTSDLPGRFWVSAAFRAQSAAVYNITTGADTNGDGVHNERPAGVTRNTGRGAGASNLDLTLTWRMSQRGRRPDVRNAAGGANRSSSSSVSRADEGQPVPSSPARSREPFKIELFIRATNVLDLVNLQNYSGVVTSPFFGLPTAAGAARRISVGTRASF